MIISILFRSRRINSTHGIPVTMRSINYQVVLLFILFSLHVWGYNPTVTRPALKGITLSTTVAPPRPGTETEEKTKKKEKAPVDDDFDEWDVRNKGPIEYLEDDLEQSRDMQDPFHILLMGETFKKPKVTINYASGSLQLVLDMPYEEAVEASMFAKQQGFSCLGTWTREKCLELGKKLQKRELAVRVVPFSPGGQRGWQAKDASSDDGSFKEIGGNEEFIDAEYWR
mmetsp:Transcript_10167/g.15605  ORF Transcript_10167/g.15605 Transcript_10167/m.15605 type:complete len:227 (-) Transcript_10167:1126-1806(-)